jgi:Uncharacterized conserved protein
MASPYQRCEELKSGIDRYIPQGEDAAGFYKELCSRISPSPFKTERDRRAYDLLFETAALPEISLERILLIHRELFAGNDNAGELRKKRIFLGSSKYPIPAPEVLVPMMQGFIRSFNAGPGTMHPVLFASAMHHKFAYIYPFSTGTLEMAQFIQNLILIKNGYPSVTIPEDRLPKYKSLLDAGRTSLDAFSLFIAECIEKTQEAVMQMLESSDMYVIPPRTEKSAPEEIPAKPCSRVFLVDDGDKISSNPVYAAIAGKPGIRKPEIAAALNMSPSAVTRALAELKKAGMIEFRGLPKTGGYLPTSARPLDYFGPEE